LKRYKDLNFGKMYEKPLTIILCNIFEGRSWDNKLDSKLASTHACNQTVTHTSLLSITVIKSMSEHATYQVSGLQKQ